MDVLVYANPYSGNKNNRKWVGRLERALRDEGLEPQVVWELPGRAEQLLEVGSGLKAIVAAGGDGSINTTVNLMRETGHLGLPFATLPVGTENLFAKQFGYHVKRPEAIAAAIGRGETRSIDLGEVQDLPNDGAVAGDGTLFTLMASVGFDAEVVHRLDAWRKDLPDGQLQRVKKLSYAKPVVRSLIGYGFPKVTLTAGDRGATGSQAYVFNLPQYGGNVGIGRHTKVADGKLHWIVFEKPGRVRLFFYHALCLIDRQLQSRTVRWGEATEVVMRPAERGEGDGVPVQADGDPAGRVPRRFRIVPKALNVIEV